MERDYFDAKFEGLENLMKAQQQNTDNYIGAVARGFRELNTRFEDHREDQEAHGAAASGTALTRVVSWLSLLMAAGLAIFEVRKH